MTSPTVHGLSLSPQTQCTHYSTPLDIIAIQHPCCQKFYACIACHTACESHPAEVWPKTQRNALAVLCGGCQRVMAVQQYLDCGSVCPLEGCAKAFNPKCKGHWGLYFEVDEGEMRNGGE